MAISHSQRMEIPVALSFTKPKKVGHLKKLTRRGWIYPGSWKNRYCVLDGTKIYFYENEKCRGSERTSGVLSLDYFDICEEGKQKNKRASNVFVISTSIRGIFDFQTKHFFSANTLPEMMEWINLIRTAIFDARNNRSRAGRAKGVQCQEVKTDEVLNNSKSVSPEKEISTPELPSPELRLFTPTKNRAKGPAGRRLPQRKSIMTTTNSSDIDDSGSSEPQRAQSMSALECISEVDTADHNWLDTSLELSTTEGRSASQNALVYKYSSSEESINLPEIGRVKQLSKMLNIPTCKKPIRNAKVIAETQESETRIKEEDHVPSSPQNKKPNSENDYSLPSSPGVRKWVHNKETENTANLDLTRKINKMDIKMQNVEQELVATRFDLASVHGGVSKVQAEIERVVLRIDRMYNQIFQVEQQLTTTIKEAQAFYDDAEKRSQEANQAKQDIMKMKEECEKTLASMKELASDPSSQL